MDINPNFCTCLHEIKNNLPRTKYCTVPCRAQLYELREKSKNDITNRWNYCSECCKLWDEKLDECPVCNAHKVGSNYDTYSSTSNFDDYDHE
jgi:hypothetical protein